MATDRSTVPLILGGHSFISQLGNDPRAGRDELTSLVAACLDSGIVCFDTTYQPERVGLGRALAELGRRGEAEIIAWNFFTDFDDDGDVGDAEAYQPHHIELMLDQLQTDRIDDLVVHAVGDEAADRRQEELAVQWRRQGLVGRLGVWAFSLEAVKRYGSDNPYDFMVQPYNTATPDAAEAFAAAKGLGWETLACSPFRRGWRLDTLTDLAAAFEGGDPADIRAALADAMLRYSLYQPNVDRLIVAMRRREWVAANAASARRGPLSETELTWLMDLHPDE
jgi:aryl-alcohol dehydrogenase-like predicted oxidoreductase